MRHYSALLLLGLILLSLTFSAFAQTDSTPTPDVLATAESYIATRAVTSPTPNYPASVTAVVATLDAQATQTEEAIERATNGELTYLEISNDGFARILSETLQTGEIISLAGSLFMSEDYGTIIFTNGLAPHSWSPNGRYLVYSNPLPNDYAILTLDTVSGQRTVIEDAILPVWSPDSSMLAFMSLESNSSQTSLEIIDVDGNNRRTLLDENIYLPLWNSETGIIVLRESDSTMVLVSPETGDLTVLPIPQESVHQQWSADRTQLLYTTLSEGYQIYDVSIYNFQTETSETILENIELNQIFQDVIFDADGEQIIVALEGQIRVYSINAPEEYEILYEHPDEGTDISHLNLSLLGDRLTFTAFNDSQNNVFISVYVMDIDGSNVQQIGDDDTYHVAPIWRP
ncbi:MAG: hypothetical protein Phog2KO_19670 [Phototrophicaceae bacterium]